MLRRSLESDEALIAVYLPMSYMVGGYTIFVPRDLVEPTSLSVEEGMRIALMGGVRSKCAGTRRRSRPARGPLTCRRGHHPGHAVRAELLAGLVPAHARKAR